MSSQFIGEVLRSTPVLFTGGFSGGVPRDLTANNWAVTTENTLPSRTQGPQAPSDGLAYYSFNGSTQEWTVADHANLECLESLLLKTFWDSRYLRTCLSKLVVEVAAQTRVEMKEWEEVQAWH